MRNFIFLEDAFEIPKGFFLFFEFEDFALKDILQYRLKNKLPYRESELLSAMKELILIFKFFNEELSFFHRDIKLENILYSSKKNCYIVSDFSESKLTNSNAEFLVGTPFYMTPENYEAFKKKETKNKSSLLQNDIYALGIVFLLMKKGKFLEELSRESLIETKKSLQEDNSLSSTIIRNMIEENPEARPNYFSLHSKMIDIEVKNSETIHVTKITEFLLNISKDLKKKAENTLEVGIGFLLINQLDKSLEQLVHAKDQFISLNDEKNKALTMFYLGKIYYKLDLTEKAANHIEPCFNQIKGIFNEIPENISLSLEILAKYYQKIGRYVDAIMHYEENLINIEKRCGNFHHKIAEINENLGDIYEKLEQNEEACKRWNEAIGILKHNDEKRNDEKITQILSKIYKFHPSEMYDENESISSPKSKISGDKLKTVLEKNDENLLKQMNMSDNLIIPTTKFEKPKKSSLVKTNFDSLYENENNESIKNKIRSNSQKKVSIFEQTDKTIQNSIYKEQLLEKNEKNQTHIVQIDENFEKELIFTNKESSSFNMKNIIKFVQSEEEFKNNCRTKENSLVFQNNFLKIKSTINILRKNDAEYDLFVDLSYENTSLIKKIENIYSKIIGESKGMFLYLQQIKANEIDIKKSVTHSVFIKFKNLKFEIPLILFQGRYCNYINYFKIFYFFFFKFIL